MIDKWRYFNGEDFYYLIEDIMDDIPMFKERKLRETISNLIDMGILVKKAFKGAPPKQFYNIDTEKLFNIIASDANLKGFKKDGFDTCKNDTFNHCKNAGVQYNNNIYNNNKDNNIEFEKKVSNETYFSHSLVRNEISHDCVGKQSQDITPPLEATNQAQTTSQDESAKETKRGRQGSDSLFEAMPNPKRKQYQAEFEEFWKMYPKKEEKGKAYALYLQKVPKIISHEELCNRLSQQRKVWEAKRTQMQYIPQCQKWLRNDTFKDNFDEILESYRQDSYRAPNQQVSSEASRMAEIDKKIEAGRFTRDMEQEHIELYGRGAIDFDEYMRIFEENERRKKEQRLN